MDLIRQLLTVDYLLTSWNEQNMYIVIIMTRKWKECKSSATSTGTLASTASSRCGWFERWRLQREGSHAEVTRPSSRGILDLSHLPGLRIRLLRVSLSSVTGTFRWLVPEVSSRCGIWSGRRPMSPRTPRGVLDLVTNLRREVDPVPETVSTVDDLKPDEADPNTRGRCRFRRRIRQQCRIPLRRSDLSYA